MNKNKILLFRFIGNIGKTFVKKVIKHFKIIFFKSKNKQDINNFSKNSENYNLAKPKEIINEA